MEIYCQFQWERAIDAVKAALQMGFPLLARSTEKEMTAPILFQCRHQSCQSIAAQKSGGFLKQY
jgi:hypothetical protein